VLHPGQRDRYPVAPDPRPAGPVRAQRGLTNHARRDELQAVPIELVTRRWGAPDSLLAGHNIE
jgi:hypothetical protein